MYSLVDDDHPPSIYGTFEVDIFVYEYLKTILIGKYLRKKKIHKNQDVLSS